MRRQIHRWLIAATALTGCGPSQPASVATVGPHQGRLLTLPDGLGRAEVVTDIKGTSPRTSEPEVVVYFLGPDSQTPLTPPPTNVSIQIYLAEAKELQEVPLKADAKARAEARFAAVPPAGFDGVVRSGRVKAQLSDREIDLAF